MFGIQVTEVEEAGDLSAGINVVLMVEHTRDLRGHFFGRPLCQCLDERRA